jgi:hypothetical protein
MFDGKFEIRKDLDNMVVMIGMEDAILLKLKGTFAYTQNVACLSHHCEGIMSSSLLWHARFSHINYEGLCLLRKNGVSGLPTIPRKLKQCDACILGKHRKQPFHDSTSRSCRKLESIHYDLRGPMHVPLQMEMNISCILLMITPGFLGCSCPKINHKLLKLLKNFMYGFKMKLGLILALFALIMEKNIHLVNLKATFTNMGSSIKPQFNTIVNRTM